MQAGLGSAMLDWRRAEGDDPPSSMTAGTRACEPNPLGVRASLPTPMSTLTGDTAVAEPIAIGGSAMSMGLPLPLPLTSYDSSASSRDTAPIDGPLLDLMPALSVSASASSAEDILVAGGSTNPFLRRSGGPPNGQRVVSMPSVLCTSPPRASPLSRSVGPDGEDVPPWRRFRQEAMLFGSPASPPLRGAEAETDRQWERHRRRRTSASLGCGGPPRPFVGSYEDSLLSGRMSAVQSAPLPFVASIGVLGSEHAPRRLKCPKHLHVPFGAVFYREPNGESTISCPYVGLVDLEAHYHSLLAPTTSSPHPAADSSKLPRFPGYQVPTRGQVQLVLKNSLDTAFKPFLIPYDLAGLDRGGRGGRTFLRQKSYTVEDDGARGKLRFAVHLQFCSPPAPAPRKGNSVSESHEPRFYLCRRIRVVFASRGLDLSDKLRVVHEGPAETGFLGADVERFGAYDGPGLEWSFARKKAKERLKLEQALNVSPAPLPPILPPSHDTQFNAYPAVSAFASATIPAVPAFHLVAPLPFAPSSPIHSASSALTFKRVPSPRCPPSLDRTLSTHSALSASRPTSAAGRSGSGEREQIGR